MKTVIVQNPSGVALTLIHIFYQIDFRELKIIVESIDVMIVTCYYTVSLYFCVLCVFCG